MMDMYNNIDVAQSLAPATYTASTNGSSVDLQGYQAATVVVSAGTITDGTHAIEVQESTDGSTFTAVASSDLQGTEPTALASNTVYRIGYMGTARYIRVVTTVTGATSGGA